MRRILDGYELSAQDLANHLGCHHLTFLDLAVADGRRAPPEWRDPALAVLQERGLSLEQAYLEHLRRSGLHIAEPGPEEDGPALDRTVAAMREGADVIYQATLRNDRWYGRADFLRRVERPSDLGPWSYEVLDAKLARETRASTILQLCLYSDLVERIQGILPENMYVIIPGETFKQLPFRVYDFLAYYRFVQRRLETAIASENGEAEPYPDPVPHCDICRWWSVCDHRRRQDDHLCLVAGISKLQIKELRSWGVNTLTGLAELPLPLERRPARGAPETYHRVREQARVQVAARRSGAPVYEPLPVVAGEGLCGLPEPSPGDIFLDLESDPFFGISGLEYLLGWTVEGATTPEYQGLWAFDPASEKAAFEAFIDFAVARWGQHPGLHIYHFAPYEPAALKRLMGRYATREDELDRLLRAERFIDLHAVARQAIRAGVESYSLNELEQLYGFERSVQLSDARLHLRAFERALELGRLAEIDDEVRPIIQGYNLDDCLSTMRLRGWLEQVRAGLVDDGQVIERPSLQRGDPSEELGDSRSSEKVCCRLSVSLRMSTAMSSAGSRRLLNLGSGSPTPMTCAKFMWRPMALWSFPGAASPTPELRI